MKEYILSEIEKLEQERKKLLFPLAYIDDILVKIKDEKYSELDIEEIKNQLNNLEIDELLETYDFYDELNIRVPSEPLQKQDLVNLLIKSISELIKNSNVEYKDQFDNQIYKDFLEAIESILLSIQDRKLRMIIESDKYKEIINQKNNQNKILEILEKGKNEILSDEEKALIRNYIAECDSLTELDYVTLCGEWISVERQQLENSSIINFETPSISEEILSQINENQQEMEQTTAEENQEENPQEIDTQNEKITEEEIIEAIQKSKTLLDKSNLQETEKKLILKLINTLEENKNIKDIIEYYLKFGLDKTIIETYILELVTKIIPNLENPEFKQQLEEILRELKASFVILFEAFEYEDKILDTLLQELKNNNKVDENLYKDNEISEIMHNIEAQNGKPDVYNGRKYLKEKIEQAYKLIINKKIKELEKLQLPLKASIIEERVKEILTYQRELEEYLNGLSTHKTLPEEIAVIYKNLGYQNILLFLNNSETNVSYVEEGIEKNGITPGGIEESNKHIVIDQLNTMCQIESSRWIRTGSIKENSSSNSQASSKKQNGNPVIINVNKNCQPELMRISPTGKRIRIAYLTMPIATKIKGVLSLPDSAQAVVVTGVREVEFTSEGKHYNKMSKEALNGIEQIRKIYDLLNGENIDIENVETYLAYNYDIYTKITSPDPGSRGLK